MLNVATVLLAKVRKRTDSNQGSRPVKNQVDKVHLSWLSLWYTQSKSDRFKRAETHCSQMRRQFRDGFHSDPFYSQMFNSFEMLRIWLLKAWDLCISSCSGWLPQCLSWSHSLNSTQLASKLAPKRIHLSVSN